MEKVTLKESLVNWLCLGKIILDISSVILIQSIAILIILSPVLFLIGFGAYLFGVF